MMPKKLRTHKFNGDDFQYGLMPVGGLYVIYNTQNNSR